MEDDCWGDWESSQKGMSFDDYEDEEKPVNPFSGISNKIQSIRADIADIGDTTSVYSLDSDISSENSSTCGDISGVGSELPSFLFASGYSQYEPRAELRVAGFKTPSLQNENFRGNTSSNIKLTIQTFILGQEASLECYRSYSAKKQLLAKAIEINDGNAITGVVLFLQQTLRQSLFQQLLMEHKAAANHYIRYLQTRCETEKLHNFFSLLGRTEEALLLRYRSLLRTSDPDLLYSKLSHFYAAECCNDFYISSEVKSHLRLLETQKALKQARNHNLTLTKNPSVMKTLQYLGEHFYEHDGSTTFLSPVEFTKIQNLSEKQHAWACLASLIKVAKWPQIESLLIKKGWLTSHGRCILPPDEVSEMLKDGLAPVDLISVFVIRIDNKSARLSLAKRLKCHKVVIDMYAAQKDKNLILQYKSKLEENSKDDVYASSVLRNLR